MAGDGWVMDIIFHVLILVANALVNLWSNWSIEILLVVSFGMQFVLVLFAGIRRRKAFSWWRPFLWFAYQVADWAARYALSNLSLRSTSREQQLVAFWAPFLLLHLGGPDNISAYSLEDNILSGREVLNVLFQFVGASIVLYKLGGSGTLLWASVIMIAVGVAKYVERVFALWQGDLGSIQSSGKKQKQKQKPRSFRPDHRGGWELDDEKALLYAHDLFHISKGAFADYSDKDPHRLKRKTRRKRKSPPLKWRDMYKVVDMELSLMYDILYTKAAVIHTWYGYIIRVLSPPFTATAFLLFLFYSKDGQRRVDVVITYILLAATFLLDMRWLLRVLGSTWTYAFLHARPQCWLHQAFLCTGRWHRFRRVVVSLDPCRLLSWAPSSYRMWSGTIGQYNLLHECTRDTPTGLCSKLGKLAKAGLEDHWNEYQYHYSRGLDISARKVREVRELLFETLRESLKKAYPTPKVYPPTPKAPITEPEPEPSLEPPTASFPEPEVRHRERDENLNFGPEFQEVILIWHIATDVFLLLCEDQNAASSKYGKAIKALSDYLVFLLTVRPDMLPGLKLQSMHEATRDALDKIWSKKGSSSSSRISPCSTTREKELASILRNMGGGVLYKKSIILSDGTKCAKVLLELRSPENFDWERSQIIRKKRLRKILEELIPELKDKEEDEDDDDDDDDDEEEEEEEEEEDEDEEEEEEEEEEAGDDDDDDDDDDDEIPVERDMDTLLKLILKAWVRLLIFVSVRCSRDSHAKQLSRGGELTTIVWILDEHASIFGIKK